jgi:hypothetical protein
MDEYKKRLEVSYSRLGTTLLFKFWSNNYLPFGFLRATGRFGSHIFLNLYLNNRMTELTSEEKHELKEYFH